MLLPASPAVHASELAGAERIVVAYPDDIAEDRARDFATQLAEERRRVRDWWGPTYEDTIRIRISGDVSVAMALVPAWRGNPGLMDVPTASAQRGNTASLHEIVHIYAPNGNRFLAEGLAVHAHDFLGGISAFPNFGQDPHVLAQRVAPDHSVLALDRFATPRPLGDRGTYIVAGSFVRFLIERYGMERFRLLYALTPLTSYRRDAGDPARWSPVYGKTIEELEREWRAFLDRGAR